MQISAPGITGSSTIDLTPIKRVSKALDRIARAGSADAMPIIEPLMIRWETILKEDNERGLLAGLDADDQPMPKTQRELSPSLSRRKGAGPPLVPRGRQSRAIALARTAHGHDGVGFRAYLGWDGFLAEGNGRGVLGMHANPIGARYPKRDVIARPRPTAVRLAREALREWGRTLLRDINGI